MQHTSASDGRDEDDGPASPGFDHVPTTGLRDQERPSEVDVDETPKHVWIIVFGFYVGAVIPPQGKPHAVSKLGNHNALDDSSGVDENVDGAKF